MLFSVYVIQIDYMTTMYMENNILARKNYIPPSDLTFSEGNRFNVLTPLS